MKNTITEKLTELSLFLQPRKIKGKNGLSPLENDFLRGLDVSFEFFPPKNDDADAALMDASKKLSALRPKFMTVTYGAGGSTREKTHATAVKIQNATNIPMAAHLTCVGATKSDIHTIAESFWNDGIRHIIALRGDMPGGAPYVPHADGYAYTSNLVEGLKKLRNFEISVAAYPEKHPDAPSLDADLDALKKKIDAGADRAITQFFFEPVTYMRFLDRVRQAGINVPIVPGILPIHNFSQVAKFANQCNTKIPDHLYHTFKALDQDPETRKIVAAVTAAEQCKVLHAMGIRNFHFYTMNKPDLVYAVCHILGLRGDHGSGHTGLGIVPQASGIAG